ncbi:DUF58 domain-containing protein [Stutzerimonas azotifigens]|uniref:DUF58 domain-containing protein n=1 Tax=Stutzerimonas azotifigens TaxID=291995 RepID=A0ABR5Z4Q1_9GAMM|nr:DUF58 domain-containing protein [Stutzerimonas azotifigens]MBA1275133.1 DUF58 domain-containing protein [Stutzerimonas azotifigens]
MKRLRGVGARWLDKRIPPAASVRLDQRRIFILPTAVGIAFGVALLLMLLAAINYQNSLAYGATFLLGSVFVVTILHTWRNLAGLVLQAGGAAPVFVGEQARLKVRLESLGPAYQAVALGWTESGLQLLDVPAKGISEVELAMPALRRGWLRPGRLRVESRFPLGILVAWSWVDLELAALVYPRPLEGELPWSAGADDSEDEGVRAQGAGADDYQGLKPWQPGESRRRLHWKAYSRGQGMLVKDFAALVGRDLLLDLDALDADLETRLSLLCHAVLELTDRQRPFMLKLGEQVLGPGDDQAHRDQCLRALALYGQAGAAGAVP